MSLLELERGEGFVVLTLADPDRRNSLTPELVGAIIDELDRAEDDDDVNAVVITGKGRAFCAGADIARLGSKDREGLLDVYGAFLRVARSRLLTISAVNGPAVGAGMNLALASDIRVAGESGRFDCRFLSLGLHPGGGHSWMLQRAVGNQTAAAMLLANQILGGPEAERVGLAWKCVPDESLLDEAKALAAHAGRTPKDVMMRAKSTLHTSEWITSQQEAVDLELDAQLWSMSRPEFATRLAALQEKVSDNTSS